MSEETSYQQRRRSDPCQCSPLSHEHSGRCQEEPGITYSSAESIEDIHRHGSTHSGGNSSCGTGPDPSTQSATSTLKDSRTWPPSGLTESSTLTLDKAMDLVVDDAVIFDANFKDAYHTTSNVAHYFALLHLGNGTPIFEATSTLAMLANEMTFSLNEDLVEPVPWRSLEEPSMTCCFGRFPGTITLNRYLGSSNHFGPFIKHDSVHAKLMQIGLFHILQRLLFLQAGSNLAFRSTVQEFYFLYDQLVNLEDPGLRYGDRTIEQDIDALSALLSVDFWSDFSKPGNQFWAKYFSAVDWDIPAELFFHQLLLSIELDRRIRFLALYEHDGTEPLMAKLPRKVAWSVALSFKIFQNLKFEDLNGKIRLVPKNKFAQLSKVLDFGYALKWPCMDEVEAQITEESKSEKMQYWWSVPSFTFLSGAVLPGPATSWMMMSCLLDCNATHGRSPLTAIGQMHHHTGFQYLRCTYWYWKSIVAKVLGAMQGTESVAGWIGPCMYTPDLESVQCVYVCQEKPVERMTTSDIHTMAKRSDPLGPPNNADSFLVSQFKLVLPSMSDLVDTIRVKELALKKVHDSEVSNDYQVGLRIAISGVLRHIHLRYDVSFIAAAACWQAGPHALHHSYAYETVRVDEFANMREWAGSYEDTVLVVEAYGTSDNAVLTRAW
ncbi:MAG: hypothetical protein Q9166_006604 [cf. Caloplaca sp. 2 TL-2023]